MIESLFNQGCHISRTRSDTSALVSRTANHIARLKSRPIRLHEQRSRPRPLSTSGRSQQRGASCAAVRMDSRKIIPWTNAEVQTFLCLVGDDKVQSQLDGAYRNESVYREVAEKMALHGFERSWMQCREKLKKMKSDYNRIKLLNETSGSDRKVWRWYQMLDAMYGQRPSHISPMKDTGLDPAATFLQSSLLLEDVQSHTTNEDNMSIRSEDGTPFPSQPPSPIPGPSTASTSTSPQPHTPVLTSIHPHDSTPAATLATTPQRVFPDHAAAARSMTTVNKEERLHTTPTRVDSKKIIPWTNAEVQTFLCLVGDETVQSQLDGAHRNESVYREVAEKMALHGFERTWIQCREKLKKMKSDYNRIKLLNDQSGVDRKGWKWYQMLDAMYGQRPCSSGREAGLDSATTFLQSTLLSEDVQCRTTNEDRVSIKSEDSTPFSSQPQSHVPGPSTASIPASPQPDTPVLVSVPPHDPAPAGMLETMPVLPGKRRKLQDQSALVKCLHEIQSKDEVQQRLNREQRDVHLAKWLEEAKIAREREEQIRLDNLDFNRAFLGVLGRLADAISSGKKGKLE